MRERTKLTDLCGKRTMTLAYDEAHNQISLSYRGRVIMVVAATAAFDGQGMYFHEVQSSPIDD